VRANASNAAENTTTFWWRRKLPRILALAWNVLTVFFIVVIDVAALETLTTTRVVSAVVRVGVTMWPACTPNCFISVQWVAPASHSFNAHTRTLHQAFPTLFWPDTLLSILVDCWHPYRSWSKFKSTTNVAEHQTFCITFQKWVWHPLDLRLTTPRGADTPGWEPLQYMDPSRPFYLKNSGRIILYISMNHATKVVSSSTNSEHFSGCCHILIRSIIVKNSPRVHLLGFQAHLPSLLHVDKAQYSLIVPLNPYHSINM